VWPKSIWGVCYEALRTYRPIREPQTGVGHALLDEAASCTLVLHGKDDFADTFRFPVANLGPGVDGADYCKNRLAHIGNLLGV
jgi:hypothetical protein